MKEWVKYTQKEFSTMTNKIFNSLIYVTNGNLHKNGLLNIFLKCDYCGEKLNKCNFIFMRDETAICEKCYKKKKKKKKKIKRS